MNVDLGSEQCQLMMALTSLTYYETAEFLKIRPETLKGWRRKVRDFPTASALGLLTIEQ
jgi:hypothetical protein